MSTIDRKKYVKDTITDFIKSDLSTKLSMCTFGFEIETQNDNNYDGDDFWEIVYNNLDREDYMDTIEYYSDLQNKIIDYIDEGTLSELMYHLSPYIFKLPNGALDNWFLAKREWQYSKKAPDKINVTSQSLFGRIYKELLIKDVKKFENRARRLGIDIYNNDFKLELFNKKLSKYFKKLDSMEEFDREICGNSIDSYMIVDMDETEYYYSRSEIQNAHPDLFNICDLNVKNKNIETTSDQSVSGVEIRTIDGLDHHEFKKCADLVFNSIEDSNHIIDKNCSAHIHIKLGDIKHYYGDGKLHGAIMEYLTFNFDQLPDPVQKRLSGGGNRWISPQLSNNKYRWVHFHSQGTIEFRLFGNIDNTEDLLTCQRIALEALAYGYQVRIGDYSRALENTYIESLLERVA